MDLRAPVAVAAALVGAGLIWLVAPDAGPPVATSQPVIAPAVAPPPVSPRAARPPSRAAPELPAVPSAHEPAPAAPTVRHPSRGSSVDRDAVQEPDLAGMAAAASARRDDVLACWDAWTETHGEPPGRLVLDLAVAEDDDGAQTVTARLPTAEPDTEPLYDCFDEVFADARFEPLAGPSMRMIWPVPRPASSR